MYAFLDIETTGLVPNENYVLEVAWVLTDYRFEPISEPKTFLVFQPNPELVFSQIDNSDFLTNMHKTSGLYDALSTDLSLPMYQILDEFIQDAVDHGAQTEDVKLAGYSISFDRDFLKAHGWYDLFESKVLPFQMHHRIMDISSNIQMWDAADRAVPHVVNQNAHRALDDAVHAMLTAQAMRDMIS